MDLHEIKKLWSHWQLKYSNRNTIWGEIEKSLTTKCVTWFVSEVQLDRQSIFFPSTEKYWWQNWISNSTSLPFVLLKFLFWGNFKILWNRAKISISIFIPCDVLKIYIYEYAVSWCKNTVIFKEQDNRRQHSESDSPDPANCTLKVHDWKNAASIFCSHTRVWQFSTLYTHVKYFQH